MEEPPSEESLNSRSYQTQLEEIASRKNTIIYLPTGSGKTYIAISLIGRFKKSLSGEWGSGAKRTFFLVNTVPLVQQQQKCIMDLCPVNKVAGYSGEDRVDVWNKNKWDQELSNNEVIVMTSQILCDMITHKYIEVKDINLLIFDECHHAIEDHPMRMVMKHFEACPKEEQPRVLGLTATLLNSNITLYKVEESLRQLETTFHATIATVNELGEVLTYSTNPTEFVVPYTTYTIPIIAEEALTLLNELKSLVENVKIPNVQRSDVKLKMGQIDIKDLSRKIVKEVRNMIVSIEQFIAELGIYGGNLSIIAYIILLEQLKRKAVTIEEDNLYRFTITHLVEVRMILSDIMKNETGFERIVRHSSDKVLHLLNILNEYNPDVVKKGTPLKVNCSRQPISAIIFTQKRFAAKILYNLLKDVIEVNPQDFGFLKHDFVVGFNVNPFNNTREQSFTKKQSQRALLKFVNKDLNTLIATSIIEEGIDIPQCHLVLRFDPPAEYRSYVQSKGRARSSESSYVILISNENKAKFMRKYDDFQKIEQHVQRMLVGKTDSRNEPTNKDIKDKLYDDEEIPTYVTEHGNRLSAQSAIQLLHRYCSTLPNDQFTIIAPMWIREKVMHRGFEHVLITILMPIASTIKNPIKGEPMLDNKSAKRSAALNACILLHKSGELNEFTLLPEAYSRVNFDQLDIKQCFPNWPEHEERNSKGVPAVGTKKRIRKHAKVYPAVLNGPCTWAYGQNTFYLHIIELKAAFAAPAESRERALYELLQRGEGYGLLSCSPLPPLCDFPMFLDLGEVTTSIRINYAKIDVDLDLFEFIKEFHYFIFYQVLEVAKKFLVFDGTKNSLYVVPVKDDGNGYDIDWNVIQQYKGIPPVAVPTLEERRAVKATRESYQYSVVSPWYRATIFPDRYIVSDVLEYMSPQSLFGTDTFGTYANYYSNKYNLEIEGERSQPLLEVRSISTRMNCLLPRSATIKSLSEKQRKLISAAQGDDSSRGFTEIFIPEFCIKYEYPGVLWYKATILPSIIHRVHMLLLAEELRVEIATATKYGQLTLNKGEKWEPVRVNIEVAKKSLLSQVEGPEEKMAALKNTVDRINNPIDESARRPVALMSMKDSVYQLQKREINKEYPWEENTEPIPSAAAILPPPIIYNDKIDILLREPVGRGPEQKDILAALTTIKSHDNFNLERAETLGDAFLKFAASLYLFHKFPTLNEGQLTNIKGRLIGNRNLYYAGEKIRLGGRMKIEGFSPRTDFVVPGFLAPKEVQEFMEEKGIRPSFLLGMQFPLEDALSGKLSSESIAQMEKRYTECDGVAEQEPQWGAQNSMQCYVSVQVTHDKSVADCVEALVGTYLVHGGVLGAIKVLEWMKIIPEKDDLASLLTRPVRTVLSTNPVPLTEIDFLLNYSRQEVEQILNYKFNDPTLLLEALTHPSYIRNRLTRSYERLEFLGDALLDFLITSHIYEQCTDFKPGDLTDLRSALVNNVTFAAYVVKLGLQKYLLSQLNPALGSAIMTFVEHQKQRNHEITEDILYLIEEEECQIAEYVEVPKTLSDIFESLAGAVYVDSGGSLRALWAVLYRVMHRELHAFARRVPRQPVAVLSEMIYACPHFGNAMVCKSEVSKVMLPVTFTKDGRQHTVHGVGHNKRQAKRAAAKLALKVLAC
ncbi:PREDICTED: endoribonuclease Dicer [Papilio polytes]|uniref:endoribonuclease Dicer n=1 Tax=Papilio polytes TaxID=76194 RepID=UPI00067657EB|nr:PREDICTED: endoribonuclease Dicer [Papilio polytes]